MIKEALFNLLPDMAGKSFLDLYAGTGSVGIEALSRDAARVVFVEEDARFMDTLKKNLLHCIPDASCECLISSVEKALRSLSLRGDRFDIVFMDPPYDKGHVHETLSEIDQAGLLRDDGMVVVQHSAREAAGPQSGRLVLEDERRYGDTVLSFLLIN